MNWLQHAALDASHPEASSLAPAGASPRDCPAGQAPVLPPARRKGAREPRRQEQTGQASQEEEKRERDRRYREARRRREAAEFAEDERQALMLRTRERNAREQEREREEKAERLEREHRRLEEAGAVPALGEMWKLGRAWKAGGIVRLWHKNWFLLEGSVLRYYPTREALLNAVAGGCSDDRGPLPGRSPFATPRSFVSKISTTISSPRSWYSPQMPGNPTTPRSAGGSASPAGKQIDLKNVTFRKIGQAGCQQAGRWLFSATDAAGKELHFACSTEKQRNTWVSKLERAANFPSNVSGRILDEEFGAQSADDVQVSAMHGLVAGSLELERKEDTHGAAPPAETGPQDVLAGSPVSSPGTRFEVEPRVPTGGDGSRQNVSASFGPQENAHGEPEPGINEKRERGNDETRHSSPPMWSPPPPPAGFGQKLTSKFPPSRAGAGDVRGDGARTDDEIHGKDEGVAETDGSDSGTPETCSSAEDAEFGVEETAIIHADPMVSQLRPGAHAVVQPWSPPDVSMPTSLETSILEPAGQAGSERDTAITDVTPGSPAVRAQKSSDRDTEIDTLTGRPPAPPPQKLQIPHSSSGWTRIKSENTPITNLRADAMAADKKVEPGPSDLATEVARGFIAHAGHGAQLGAQEKGAGVKRDGTPEENARELVHTHIKAYAQDRNAQVGNSPPAIQISTSALAVPAQHDTPESPHNWLSHASSISEGTVSKGGHGPGAPAGSFWLSTTNTGNIALRVGKGVDPAPWLASRTSSSAEGKLTGPLVSGGERSRVVTPSWDLGRENDTDRLTSWEKMEKYTETQEKSKGVLALDALGCDPRARSENVRDVQSSTPPPSAPFVLATKANAHGRSGLVSPLIPDLDIVGEENFRISASSARMRMHSDATSPTSMAGLGSTRWGFSSQRTTQTRAKTPEPRRTNHVDDALCSVPPSSLKAGTGEGEGLEKAIDGGGMNEVPENISTGEKAGQDFLQLMHASSRRASEDRAGAREGEREEGEEQAEHGASHVENGKMDHGIIPRSPGRTPADYAHASTLLSSARARSDTETEKGTKLAPSTPPGNPEEAGWGVKLAGVSRARVTPARTHVYTSTHWQTTPPDSTRSQANQDPRPSMPITPPALNGDSTVFKPRPQVRLGRERNK